MGIIQISYLREILEENVEEKVLELLAKNEPMRPGEIAEALGLDKKEVDKIIKKLKEGGKVISPKRCFYSVEK